MKIIIKSLISFFILTQTISAKDFTQDFSPIGQVNWTKGEVVVTGLGIMKGSNWTIEEKINAHRAAKLDALRKLLQIINKINFDSNTKVKEIMENNSQIKTKVSGYIKNFTEKEVKFTKDGICKLEVTLPINGDGSISDIFLGEEHLPKVSDFITKEEKTIQEQQEQTPEKEEILPLDEEDKKVLQKAQKTYTEDKYDDYTTSKNVSGLVINAGQVETRPALNPKIVSSDGETLYSFKKADRDFRKINGLASYATTLDDAYLDKRVIKTPFIIDALSTYKNNPCILVVDADDAKKFLEQKGSNRAIKHCRVIIVTEDEKDK